MTEKKTEIKIPENEDKVKPLVIEGDDLYLKIPNRLESITKARKILSVYEDELNSVKKEENLVCSEVNIQTPEVIEVEKPKVPEKKQVEVKSFDENYKVCPLCNGKLKKKKIKSVGNVLTQKVVCKNRKCNFERNYQFSI